jgi:hypothetical protein
MRRYLSLIEHIVDLLLFFQYHSLIATLDLCVETKDNLLRVLNGIEKSSKYKLLATDLANVLMNIDFQVPTFWSILKSCKRTTFHEMLIEHTKVTWTHLIMQWEKVLQVLEKHKTDHENVEQIAAICKTQTNTSLFRTTPENAAMVWAKVDVLTVVLRNTLAVTSKWNEPEAQAVHGVLSTLAARLEALKTGMYLSKSKV